MSMGDAPDPEVVSIVWMSARTLADEQIRGLRKGRGNPRLTLGIDEDEISILDSFREEAAHIGSDVSKSWERC